MKIRDPLLYNPQVTTTQNLQKCQGPLSELLTTMHPLFWLFIFKATPPNVLTTQFCCGKRKVNQQNKKAKAELNPYYICVEHSHKVEIKFLQ